MYPAGYHGNYLKWAIEVSDLDLKNNVPLNPINYNNDTKFGGSGTSHYNLRFPTHTSTHRIVAWQLRHKPNHSKIYLINSGTSSSREDNFNRLIRDILYITTFDENAVFVQIHDNDDSDTTSYGLINCFTKWPIFGKLGGYHLHYPNFNPETCGNDIEFRNIIAKNNLNWGIKNLSISTLNEKKSQEDQHWFDIRNYYTEHEVNEEQFVNLKNVNLNQRYLSININDIPSNNIISFVKKLFLQYNISDNFDTQYFEEFNPEYIKVQKNLEWFDSINNWRETGNLDDYLMSHSIIESQVLKNLKEGLEIEWNDQWDSMSLKDINNVFFDQMFEEYKKITI